MIQNLPEILPYLIKTILKVLIKLPAFMVQKYIPDAEEVKSTFVL